MKTKMNKKTIIPILITVILIIIAVIIALFVKRGGLSATTMRLLRMEGTVNLEENGISKTIVDNLRLKSGNSLTTEQASLASISLDETKIVTLDELSRAEFLQKRKKIDLNLTKGSLFFEVKKPLEDDETFDIRTSTMIVGIRGTSGYVTVDSDGNWNIVVTDGKVHVTGTNPNTGEVKEIDVSAGQRCTVYLYDRDKDSVKFTLDEAKENDLPNFVIQILRDNPELLEKVVSDTNWSKPIILGIEEIKEAPVEDDDTEDAQDSDTKKADSEKPVDTTDTEDISLSVTTNENTPRSAITVNDSKTRVQPFVTSEVDGKMILADGTIFDPEYYARMNPDVVALYGNDKYALLEHYLLNGRRENRCASEAEQLSRANAISSVTDSDDSEDDDSSSDSSGSSGNVTSGYSVDANGNVYDENNNPIGSIVGSNLELSQAGAYTLPITVNGTSYGLSNITNIQSGSSIRDRSADTQAVIDKLSNNGVSGITIEGRDSTIRSEANGSYSGAANNFTGLQDLISIGAPGTYRFNGSDTLDVDPNGSKTYEHNAVIYDIDDSSGSVRLIDTQNNNTPYIFDANGNVIPE